MTTFLSDLFNSIFTPGPTPSIVIATNASFAVLQAVLLILLAVTYNVHYAVLSFLCAGLWWAINWFVTELEVADQQEAETKRLQEARGKWQDNQGADDSETETEGGGDQGEGGAPGKRFEGTLRPEDAQGALRKRRSLGEASSGDLSTDSEWDKVEEAEDE